MAHKRCVEPHSHQTQISDSGIPRRVEGELFLQEVQFNEEDGKILFIEKEDNSNSKYLPVVEKIHKRYTHAHNGDSQKDKRCPILFEGKVGDEVNDDTIQVLDQNTKGNNVDS